MRGYVMKETFQPFGRLLQRIAHRTRDDWRREWASGGEPWRTEAEISPERQAELRDMATFDGVELNRADVEWLLHALPSGPLTHVRTDRDPGARVRGLDLYGADLRGQDLSELPLAETDFTMALLTGAKLERADLSYAVFDLGSLKDANLRNAMLYGASVQDCATTGARFDGAVLTASRLENAPLDGCSFQNAVLPHVNLRGASLQSCDLSGAILSGAWLESAALSRSCLAGANLTGAYLAGAFLNEAILDGETRLNDIILADSEGWGPQLVDVQWGDANLSVVDWSPVRNFGQERRIYLKSWLLRQDRLARALDRVDACSTATRAYRQLSTALRAQGLSEAANRFAYRARVLERQLLASEASFDLPLDTPLTVPAPQPGPLAPIVDRIVDQLSKDGSWPDEPAAPRSRLSRRWSAKGFRGRLVVWTRKTERLGRKQSARFAWFLLDVIAGYGYIPLRCVISYLTVVVGFSFVYARQAHNWNLGDALITSIYSFHGRSLGSGYSSITTGMRGVSAAEAVIGLLLEITFIATLTQRIFRQ
jgi:uncharacterized protein YjbI with pentapeptide repeats